MCHFVFCGSNYMCINEVEWRSWHYSPQSRSFLTVSSLVSEENGIAHKSYQPSAKGTDVGEGLYWSIS